MIQSHLELAVDLANRFERLKVKYVIGGSVASSLVGEPRSTVDIDVALVLGEGDLDRLLASVSADFYVAEQAARRAFVERDSFNIIHTEAALKADLFVLGDGMLDVNQIARRRQVEVPTNPPALLWITSTEDQILRKLDWYQRGGSVSDRQWRDVVTIIDINRATLDETYLGETAEEIGLTLLLRSALLAAQT